MSDKPKPMHYSTDPAKVAALVAAAHRIVDGLPRVVVRDVTVYGSALAALADALAILEVPDAGGTIDGRWPALATMQERYSSMLSALRPFALFKRENPHVIWRILGEGKAQLHDRDFQLAADIFEKCGGE